MEKRFLILTCPRCHIVQVVDGRNKSKTCASCNRRFEIAGLQILGSGRDAREARLLAAGIKAKASSSNQT